MSAPAFQFYPDDFLGGTMILSQDEVGAYIRLLCHQWTRGALPADPAKLRRLAGGPVSEEVLAKFDKGEDGQLRNGRMEAVRAKLQHFQTLQREKGLKSAAARKHPANGSTAVQPRFLNGGLSVPTEAQPGELPEGQPPTNSPVSSLQSPNKGVANPLGSSLTTPPFEGAWNHPAEEAEVVRHFERMGADYTADEIHEAWLGFQATATEDGQWTWGRQGRPLSDWRAAFELRLSSQRALKKTAPAGGAKTMSVSMRVIALRNDVAELQSALQTLAEGPARKRLQVKLDRKIRELEDLEENGA